MDCLELGNLDARRDWGFAKEYVDGMWRMLQVDEPDTFVLATNRTETVRDFVEMAFKAADSTSSFGVPEETKRQSTSIPVRPSCASIRATIVRRGRAC